MITEKEIRSMTSSELIALCKELDPTDDEINLMKESYCEACKGAHFMDESGCYKLCDGFLEELPKMREEMESESNPIDDIKAAKELLKSR